MSGSFWQVTSNAEQKSTTGNFALNENNGPERDCYSFPDKVEQFFMRQDKRSTTQKRLQSIMETQITVENFLPLVIQCCQIGYGVRNRGHLT